MNTAWARVLIVDDEASIRFTLRTILEDVGITVEEAENGQVALQRIQAGGIDLVITDLKMPKMGGLELLQKLTAAQHPVGTIVITAHGSERHAVEVIQAGAIDYFSKPFDPADVLKVVASSLARVRLSAENMRLRGALLLSSFMVFSSPQMFEVAELVERIAARDVTVLITGESGTGKELVARAIAHGSARRNAPFVTFNCAAVPREIAEAELFGHSKGAFTGAESARRGLFREAHSGTLFLDEVAELDLEVQGALLRVIQEREVRPVGQDRTENIDIRLITATNQDLVEATRTGTFRSDLYYRLNVVEIHLSPLRERPGDIRPLAEHFLRQAIQRFGMGNIRLSESTLSALESAAWPGNVRQLQHVIERLVVLSEGPVIHENPFINRAQDASSITSLSEQVARFEHEIIARTLRETGGNQSEAARRLEISRTTLIEKMKRHGLTPNSRFS